MDKYKVDDSGRHIKLQADVGTSGIAVTSVFLTRDGISNLVLESEEFSGGDIPFKKIGINRKLKATELDIEVGIDLSDIPEERWPDEVKNVINAIFTIRGGPDGEVDFPMKGSELDDSGLPDVFITKQIEIK